MPQVPAAGGEKLGGGLHSCPLPPYSAHLLLMKQFLHYDVVWRVVFQLERSKNAIINLYQTNKQTKQTSIPFLQSFNWV